MSFWVVRAALVALAAMILAPATAIPADEAGLQCELVPTEIVRAARTVDGDTLQTTAGETVRLAGIEAAKKDGFAAPFAGSARDWLDGQTHGRDLSAAVVGPGPDRYGRRHVHVFTPDGVWLQAALVGAGFARVRPFPGEESCLPALLEAEDAARQTKSGLWADGDHAVRDANDPSLWDRNGLYEIVEGRVLSVGHGRSMVFLDFGRVYWQDFTIMVPGKLADQLAESGYELDDIADRRVRVRGVIEESGGPAIRIGHPVAIEVLDDR